MPKSSKKKHGRKKAKKDPNKPKRACSSFMFFANEKRPDLRKEFPTYKITEIGKKLGEMWKALTPDEKKKFDEIAQKDQERYQKAMEGYQPPSSSSESESEDEPKKKKRKKKAKKDPSKPKRSMSSFMFFANAKRPQVREKYPNSKITDIGKRLSELWKEIDPDEKKKYEEMAARDKERYAKAMKDYKPPAVTRESSSSDSSSDDSD